MNIFKKILASMYSLNKKAYEEYMIEKYQHLPNFKLGKDVVISPESRIAGGTVEIG